MGFRAPVVAISGPRYRLLSYGGGVCYEIERIGSHGHTTFVQGDDAQELSDALDSMDETTSYDDVLHEWYHAPALV